MEAVTILSPALISVVRLQRAIPPASVVTMPSAGLPTGSQSEGSPPRSLVIEKRTISPSTRLP